MKFRKIGGRLLACCLAVALAAGHAGERQAVYADTSAQSSTANTPFHDVAAGHWAEKHIAKLALQQIIQGTGGGAFRPSDQVSQQDAVLMAIRFLGKTDEVDTDDAIIFPASFVASEYAKPYVNYAFATGLLNRGEEYAAADARPDQAWGQQAASREWVAQLMIRALDQEQLAANMAGQLPPFADSSQIAPALAGAVSAAVSLGLMNGVSETRFDPKGSVTRAMMATLLSRAQGQSQVQYSGATEGVLTAITPTEVKVYDAGSERELAFARSAVMPFRYDSERAVAVDELKLYTAVYVLTSATGSVYLEQVSEEEQVQRKVGRLESVNAAEQVLWLRIGADFERIPYTASVPVSGTDGATLTVGELSVDTELEVLLATFRQPASILSITVKGAPINKQASGVIVSITENTVVIRHVETAAEETWRAAADIVVTWNSRISALGDLMPGDAIDYTVANSELTRITVKQSQAKTIAADFDSITGNGSRLIYTVAGELTASAVVPNAPIYIEGYTEATYADLVAGDKLELTVNDALAVTAIRVLNRAVDIVNGATVVNYDTEKRLLTFQDAVGRASVVALEESTRITLNGSPITLASAAPQLTRNKKVSIGYTANKAVTLSFVFQYTGTLTSLNTVTRQLTLVLPDTSSVTLSYTTPFVEVYGKTSASLADLRTGDTVTVGLTINQDGAASVRVHTVLQQEIVAVNSTARTIRLRQPDGSVQEYTVPASWNLRDAQGAVAQLSAFKAGDRVNVTYAGRQPEGLKLVEYRVGKLTAVGAGSLTLMLGTGNTVEVPLGTGFRVVRGTVEATTTAGLAVGDWVEIGKDANERTLVYAATVQKRKFNRYDAANSLLYVLALSPSSEIRFSVTPETRFTSGGSVITVQSLANGNDVNLYLLNNRLIEVERL